MESIRQMTNRRLHGISPTSNYNDSRDTQSVRVQKAPLDETKKSRKAIKDAYFSNFPETMIIDVCWAARQHRREWDRWLKGELKDGCKPDRVFRAVMTSDKGPKEYRPEQRPKDWK
jgi:hypothetical protein